MRCQFHRWIEDKDRPGWEKCSRPGCNYDRKQKVKTDSQTEGWMNILRPQAIISRKARLRPIAPKKQEWTRQYNAIHEKVPYLIRCAGCHRPSYKDELDRHHPWGRRGARILDYLYICRSCVHLGGFVGFCGLHDKIHSLPDWAYEIGWLQPEYRKHKSQLTEEDANHPIPWERCDEAKVLAGIIVL